MFELLIPSKYLSVMDEIPGLLKLRPEFAIKHPDFDLPLSLNAEVCLSSFDCKQPLQRL